MLNKFQFCGRPALLCRSPVRCSVWEAEAGCFDGSSPLYYYAHLYISPSMRMLLSWMSRWREKILPTYGFTLCAYTITPAVKYFHIEFRPSIRSFSFFGLEWMVYWNKIGKNRTFVRSALYCSLTKDHVLMGTIFRLGSPVWIIDCLGWLDGHGQWVEPILRRNSRNLPVFCPANNSILVTLMTMATVNITRGNRKRGATREKHWWIQIRRGESNCIASLDCNFSVEFLLKKSDAASLQQMKLGFTAHNSCLIIAKDFPVCPSKSLRPWSVRDEENRRCNGGKKSMESRSVEQLSAKIYDFVERVHLPQQSTPK